MSGSLIVSWSMGLTDSKSDGSPIYTIGRGLPIPYFFKDVDGAGIRQGYWFFTIVFIFDLIFWYFISCSEIWIYDKFKKRSSPNKF